MSARARVLLPLLWAVKMEGLVDLEGRARPVVVGGVVVEARREERVEEKAELVEWLVLVGLVVRGRGSPYREGLDVMTGGEGGIMLWRWG